MKELFNITNAPHSFTTMIHVLANADDSAETYQSHDQKKLDRLIDCLVKLDIVVILDELPIEERIEYNNKTTKGA